MDTMYEPNRNIGVRQDPCKRRRFIGLYHGGFTLEEIASHLNLTTSRAGQIKLRMEKDGWVSPETRGVSKKWIDRSVGRFHEGRSNGEVSGR